MAYKKIVYGKLIQYVNFGNEGMRARIILRSEYEASDSKVEDIVTTSPILYRDYATVITVNTVYMLEK